MNIASTQIRDAMTALGTPAPDSTITVASASSTATAVWSFPNAEVRDLAGRTFGSSLKKQTYQTILSMIMSNFDASMLLNFWHQTAGLI